MAITKPTANLYLDTRTTLKKTGKHPVKITIYYLGVKRRYSIPHSFTIEEWEKLNSAKLRDTQLRDEKVKLVFYTGKKFDEALTKIDEPFTFEKFKSIYFKTNKSALVSKDVYALFHQYIDKLKESDKIGNSEIYNTALNSFQRFKTRLTFRDITRDFLEGYEKHMLQDGKAASYIAMNFRCLRAIYNLAISEGLANHESYPFSKSSHDKNFKIKKGNNNKKALTIDELHLLKGYKSKTPAQRKAYLFWWFSFYVNGLNMKDICQLKQKNIIGDKIEFKRAKTIFSTTSNELIRLSLSTNIQAIIDEIGNLDKSPDAYIFNVLRHGITAQQVRDMVQSFTHNINKHLKQICIELELSSTITTSWARHSFSTYLKRRLVPVEVISEALGHTSVQTTRNYLASFTDETLEKIADLLDEI